MWRKAILYQVKKVPRTKMSQKCFKPSSDIWTIEGMRGQRLSSESGIKLHDRLAEKVNFIWTTLRSPNKHMEAHMVYYFVMCNDVFLPFSLR